MESTDLMQESTYTTCILYTDDSIRLLASVTREDDNYDAMVKSMLKQLDDKAEEFSERSNHSSRSSHSKSGRSSKSNASSEARRARQRQKGPGLQGSLC